MLATPRNVTAQRDRFSNMWPVHRQCLQGWHMQPSCKITPRALRTLARRESRSLGTPVALTDGKPVTGPNLSVEVNGLMLPNPFVIASGPPGTNYKVMKKAFDEGWGAVICKTLSLDSSKIHNVTPRYARTTSQSGDVTGWENIELISDRPFETMLTEMKQLKQEYPDRVLIASVMEELNKDAWEEIIGRCDFVDCFEINFSCPHGMPERKMGMAMGQDPDLVQEVCAWVAGVTDTPVWAKMTPNITDIKVPARRAMKAGMSGVSAINTIQSVMSINLDTLRPEPCVEGHSTPGGYSGKAVKPIALAKCMELSRLIQDEFEKDKSLSAIGGVESGTDAAEYLLLGASTVQVCTGVMVHGYSLVQHLCGGLQSFMTQHSFENIEDFRGAALPYFTTHSQLYDMQSAAIRAKRLAKSGLANDSEWTGDGFVAESKSMVSNA